MIRSRSGNIQEQQFRKPGNYWDRSSDGPCPEVRCSSHLFGHLSSPEEEEDPHMVTGGPEEIRKYPHTTTGIQEKTSHCSPGTSSGKQKKARSTSQLEHPATIEADQILVAPQQLATNSNSASFNNNISRISKLPKSLTTTMPTFDGKSEKK